MCHQSGWRRCQSTPQVKFICLKVFILRLKIESEIPERDYVFTTWKSRHRRQPRTKHLKDSGMTSRQKGTLLQLNLQISLLVCEGGGRRRRVEQVVVKFSACLTPDWSGSRRLCCDEHLESAEELEKGPLKRWLESVSPDNTQVKSRRLQTTSSDVDGWSAAGRLFGPELQIYIPQGPGN